MTGLFIDGQWQNSVSGDTRDIHCPADGRFVITVPEGTEEDTIRAIRAARRAFDHGDWPTTSSLERGALLGRVADLLDRDKAEVERPAMRSARPASEVHTAPASTVWINDFHPYLPQAEWGGYKQSGFGRELGLDGLSEYQETKHIWHNINPAPDRWFDGAEESES